MEVEAMFREGIFAELMNSNFIIEAKEKYWSVLFAGVKSSHLQIRWASLAMM